MFGGSVELFHRRRALNAQANAEQTPEHPRPG